MKKLMSFVLGRLGTGLVILAPLYLCLLLLLKAVASLRNVVDPVARLIPDYVPAEYLLSVLLILSACFFLGMFVRTHHGQGAWQLAERSFFQRIPFYAVIRGLTQQVAGKTEEQAWKPALVEIEDALVPGFIIERVNDSFTVFVPSAPTPLAGTIYLLSAARVHPLDVPFTQALGVISRWGVGTKDLVAAMTKTSPP